MTRYILIDNHSGYIFGDTADMPHVVISTPEGQPMTQSDMTGPIDAARWLDEAVIGEYARSYEEVYRLASSETGYLVYRADINGSKAISNIHDGRDRETIAEVVALCEHVATIRCTYAPEGD